MTQTLRVVEWVILGYFISINSVYLILETLSLLRMTGYLRERALDDLPRRYSGHDPLVSIVVPAYNEEAVIEITVKALLQLDYREFEIIVVNDGSTDATVREMIERFEMEAVEEGPAEPLPSQPIRAVYRSKRHANLRLLDKENGGKADALNAGVNAAVYPLVCGVDADSILQRDTLRRLARPFIDDPRTVAVGGTLRVANGCKVSDGFFHEAGLSRNVLALIQVVEYLRAFLFGRFAWDAVNAVLIISGALGMFDRETLLRIGGYRKEPATE
ncbi:MAG: glycosyltransferase family 2 protein, partial [Candidatus Binatia bacterium]